MTYRNGSKTMSSMAKLYSLSKLTYFFDSFHTVIPSTISDLHDIFYSKLTLFSIRFVKTSYNQYSKREVSMFTITKCDIKVCVYIALKQKEITSVLRL